MGREYELKFSATREQQSAIRAGFALDWQEISMETTYYDTPDKALGARRWMLRRRKENGRSVCTLKTPGADGGRGEWETECDSVEAAISELCKLGCPVELPELAKNGLAPLCGARFTRLAGLLTPEDCTLELALDSGVLIGGGKEIPLCEIEVELKSGSEAAVDRFANTLAAEFHLIPEMKSKYARTLALITDR